MLILPDYISICYCALFEFLYLKSYKEKRLEIYKFLIPKLSVNETFKVNYLKIEKMDLSLSCIDTAICIIFYVIIFKYALSFFYLKAFFITDKTKK